MMASLRQAQTDNKHTKKLKEITLPIAITKKLYTETGGNQMVKLLQQNITKR